MCCRTVLVAQMQYRVTRVLTHGIAFTLHHNRPSRHSMSCIALQTVVRALSYYQLGSQLCHLCASGCILILEVTGLALQCKRFSIRFSMYVQHASSIKHTLPQQLVSTRDIPPWPAGSDRAGTPFGSRRDGAADNVAQCH